MKKVSPASGDFFAKYHTAQFQKFGKYFFSGVLSIFLAFSFVSYSQSGNLGGLMAQVGQLTKSSQYDADLILKKSENTLTIILGSTAEEVDSIGFTLLSDPTRFDSVTSVDPNIAISFLSEGMFRIVKKFDTETIPAGTTIAVLQTTSHIEVPINMIDTEFTSGGVKYALTNKSE